MVSNASSKQIKQFGQIFANYTIEKIFIINLHNTFN